MQYSPMKFVLHVCLGSSRVGRPPATVFSSLFWTLTHLLLLPNPFPCSFILTTLSADIDVLYLCYFYWVEIGLLLLLLLLLLTTTTTTNNNNNNNNNNDNKNNHNHNHNGRRGSLVINGARNGQEISLWPLFWSAWASIRGWGRQGDTSPQKIWRTQYGICRPSPNFWKSCIS